ncbi:MAG TPA: glycosyltransferase family 2 protein [Actinomycetota bacterium]|jgi:glycosyltransferase involved in cell wall biosynthesis|nr:glycosyltransferase family 2 protein [Actinomycetota bacterium]
MGGLDGARPRLTIGLPIYNGEQLLPQAIESLLTQKYDDFEVVISDNASVDGTPELCAAYAAQDPRIRYVRNQRNLGSIPNFNRLVGLARGEYFKWAAHDDWCEPSFVGRCVEVLDADPGVVLCHAKAIRVDEAGDTLVVDLDPLDVRSPDPAERFRQVLWSMKAIYPIYGVIRTDALRRTQLFRSHSGSDRILLAELSLLGQLYQLPELLLYERETLSSRSNRKPSFFDTANKDRPPFKHWRLCSGHLGVVLRSRQLTGAQKADLVRSILARYAIRDGRLLLADVKQAGHIMLAGDWR